MSSKAQEAEAKALAFNAHQYTNILAVIVARDEAQANYRWMVERACDTKLDGYRELGQRAADAENALDVALAMLKELREDITPAYKAGRIPAESFVRAGNVIDTLERGRSNV